MVSVLVLTTLLTIDIAESNPNKFRLSVGEIETRKNFIRETRLIVNVSIIGSKAK